MRPSLLLPILAWLESLPLPQQSNDFAPHTAFLARLSFCKCCFLFNRFPCFENQVEAFAGEAQFTRGLERSGFIGTKMDVTWLLASKVKSRVAKLHVFTWLLASKVKSCVAKLHVLLGLIPGTVLQKLQRVSHNRILRIDGCSPSA